ncbi:NIPSNAP family protein [Actinomadura sp. 7K534]|uniref:NIPSNAP family protein n=1 Tax=Actinomadura sp. 7K534 TaxID=2530366 RepID=UPI001A9D4C14|nr:NIPSNAP family protein [Actinomadura sp. 7K534]
MNVIELRQYRLHPGRRDELVEIFDREFLESQEEAGIAVLGQFHDLDDPDKFVWLRGFADMDARGKALPAFYDGPVWAEHGLAASATMVDASDARLLRPLRGLPDLPPRPPAGAAPPPTRVTAFLWSFGDRLAEAEPVMRDEVVPRFAPDALALASLTAENNFPRLPLRTGDGHVVVITTGPGAVPAGLPAGIPEPERLRLAPTGRSLLGAVHQAEG